MQNPHIALKITQGMYVLTTVGGGCIVDAVSQVNGEAQPLIAVAVMKTNYTHELMQNNDRFALSVIGKNSDPNIIKTFGFQSMRDADKFAQAQTSETSGINTVNGTLGYMILDKVDSVDTGTHTLFIGRYAEGRVTDDSEPMSYAYYAEHKSELTKATTAAGKTAWVCTVCGYVYYGDEIPDGYVCPLCGVGADLFEKVEK